MSFYTKIKFLVFVLGISRIKYIVLPLVDGPPGVVVGKPCLLPFLLGMNEIQFPFKVMPYGDICSNIFESCTCRRKANILVRGNLYEGFLQIHFCDYLCKIRYLFLMDNSI